MGDRSAGGDAEAALSAGNVEFEAEPGQLRYWPPKSSHTAPTAATLPAGITACQLITTVLCGNLSLLLSKSSVRYLTSYSLRVFILTN